MGYCYTNESKSMSKWGDLTLAIHLLKQIIALRFVFFLSCHFLLVDSQQTDLHVFLDT